MNSENMAYNILSATHDEINLFKVDFEVILRKVNMMLHTFLEAVPNIIIALIFFSLFFILGKFLRKLICRRTRVPLSIKLVLERVTGIIFTFIGLFIALAIIFPSIKPVDLVGGVGILSLAIGFAVKNLLHNFLSGILILIQQPFRVGDEIKHNDLEGVVEFINIRYTILVGFDGRKFLIPNGEIYANTLVINTLSHYRSSYFEININDNLDIGKILPIILTAIQGVEGVLKDPAASVAISNISGNTVTVKCVWTTSPFNKDILKVRGKVLKTIKETLVNNNFSLAVNFDLFSQTFIDKINDTKKKQIKL